MLYFFFQNFEKYISGLLLIFFCNSSCLLDGFIEIFIFFLLKIFFMILAISIIFIFLPVVKCNSFFLFLKKLNFFIIINKPFEQSSAYRNSLLSFPLVSIF